MKTTKLNVIFCVLSLFIFCSTAMAVTVNDAQTEMEVIFEMSLEELLSLEVQIASKTKETTANAPSSVTVFTQDQIHNMGISTLDELLNYVPGFQSTKDISISRARRFSVRGRSTPNSESLLVLIDGHRINDGPSGGAALATPKIPTENIEQVEIIRGPGSALYGSNAFLGVINIITEKKADYLAVTLGDTDLKQVSMSQSKEISDDLSMHGFMQILDDEGYEFDSVTDVFGRTGPTRDPVESQTFYTTMDYKELSVHFNYMFRELRDFMPYGFLGDGIQRQSHRYASLSADYHIDLTEKLNLVLEGSYHQYKLYGIGAVLPEGFEVAPGIVTTESRYDGPVLDQYTASTHIGLQYDFSDRNHVIMGCMYDKMSILDSKSVGTHNLLTGDYEGDFGEIEEYTWIKEEDRDVVAIYLQDQHIFSDFLKITAGGRYDYYSDFGSTFNPRAALVVTTPFESLNKPIFKLMYGRAFRAPNFTELYSINNPILFGDPDLEPEKIETYEFSWVQEVSKTQFTLTYFNNKIEDIISLGAPVAHPDNPLNSPTYTNSGELETEGCEFEIKSTPWKRLVVSGTYTYFIDGDALLVSPSSASLAVNYSTEKFNYNVNGIYREKMDGLSLHDSYSVWNAAIRYSFNPSISLQFNVQNVFDEEYSTHTFAPIPDNALANRGRTFNMELRTEM